MPSFRRSYTGPSSYKPPEEEVEPLLDADLDTPVSLEPEPAPEPPQDIPVPEFPRTPDHSADLAALRDREDILRKQGVIASMGDKINAAFVGRAPDAHAADAFTSQAALERSRYGEDRALEAGRMKEEQAATLADPNSAANVQYRATIAPVLGERMVKSIGPAFSRLTKAQIEGIIPNLKTRFDQDKSLDEAMAKADEARAKALFEGEKFEETKRNNKEQNRIADVNAHRVSTGEGGSDGSEQEGIAKRASARATEDFAKYMEKKAGLMQAYMKIARQAPELILGKVPAELDNFASDEDRFLGEAARMFGGKRVARPAITDLTATVNSIADDIRHGLYGSAQTDPEMAKFLKVFDTSLRSGWQAQALALNLFRGKLGAEINARSGGIRSTRPDDYKNYMRETGYDVVMPLFTNGLNTSLPAASIPEGVSPGSAAPALAPSAAQAPTPSAAPAQAPAAAPIEKVLADGTKVRSYDGGKTWKRVKAVQ